MKRIFRLVRYFAVLGLAGLLAPSLALAQCKVDTPTPLVLGTVTSLLVNLQQQATSSPKAGVSCKSMAVGIGSADVINGTVTTTNSGKLLGPTGDTVSYTMFSDKDFTRQLTIGQRYNWADSGILTWPGWDGGAASMSLYLRTVTGSNVTAGTYTDTVSILWEWELCNGAAILRRCLGDVVAGSTRVSIPVTLVVTNDCTMTVPDVSFGAAPAVSGFAPVSGSLSMNCTKGMLYTVGMSPGVQAATNGRRQMTNAGKWLQYDIYDASTGTIWGQTSNRVSSNGAADGVSVKQFPYVAKIYKDQLTPPPGTYLDTVIVDVRY
ncbi:secreted pili protein involved in motility and biofilm formation [Pandoraea aquatica]|uniref:Secreted pili protein involved in motility and biofilm formation n=1 Tax=Pandoraea aquatica TaxID=2508290 RepID=A0A5E4RPY9_9BURK|nr:spore coat U domain-containing protein [Pandoraea aquatica]VVD64129.1 secreted pili protein involved in motility and biofilm formation [Pandoraea aquatica]